MGGGSEHPRLDYNPHRLLHQAPNTYIGIHTIFILQHQPGTRLCVWCEMCVGCFCVFVCAEHLRVLIIISALVGKFSVNILCVEAVGFRKKWILFWSYYYCSISDFIVTIYTQYYLCYRIHWNVFCAAKQGKKRQSCAIFYLTMKHHYMYQ